MSMSLKPCDRCGHRPMWPDSVYCEACGDVWHRRCPTDRRRHRALCPECWAILAHVERVISCASGCDCEERYAGLLREARRDA
jgi:hypothetical protein